MAVALGVHSCGNIPYIIANGIIAGSAQRCHEAQTLTAFLWFGKSLSPGFSGLADVRAFGCYAISAILVGALSSGGVSIRRSRSGVIPQMRSV